MFLIFNLLFAQTILRSVAMCISEEMLMHSYNFYCEAGLKY